MYSKEFIKFMINSQSSEPSKRNELKLSKETKNYSGKLAAILVTCTK